MTHRLVRVELTVSDLDQAERFYVDGLGFAVAHRGVIDPAMATLLGAEQVTAVTLRRGGQTLVLQAFQPSGDRYPGGATSCDQLFQHFAVPVSDIKAAYARLQAAGPSPISPAPQLLPARSGGVVAFKFRDPDGHPVELIEFPDRHDDGIDHSAIVVMDVARSIEFYRDQLNFSVAARQTNTGPEQDRLDGLASVSVEVVALAPKRPTPHLELLGYRSPRVRPTVRLAPRDIAATRVVLEVAELPGWSVSLADGSRARLIHDPDEHAIVLISYS
ncbi:VOC family protein [Rhodopila sp.]|uniref:VOC family protein n=1 Tax=Rhodopila sp. TaxID=2480087 RepID=UPI003D0CC1A6